MLQLINVPLLTQIPQLTSSVLLAPVGGILPPEPQVEIEYDFECTAPSANETCDGKIRIFAWLHVTSRRQLDASTTWLLDRKILPQRFELTWELDLDLILGNEIEECRPPKWTDLYRGADNLDVGGYSFKHLKPLTMTPDPADDSGDRLTADLLFQWQSDFISLGNLQGQVTAPLVGATAQGSAGVKTKPYDLKVNWLIDLLENVDAAERSELADTILSETLDDDLYCFASSSGGTLRRGEGKTVLAEEDGIVNNDRLVKT